MDDFLDANFYIKKLTFGKKKILKSQKYLRLIELDIYAN